MMPGTSKKRLHVGRRQLSSPFGEKRYPIRWHDVIACLPGGPEVAHQIINTGTTTMRYLSLSTLVEVEACEYPDSGKVLIVAASEEIGRFGECSVLRMRSVITTARTIETGQISFSHEAGEGR
jgi:hypothetical protein